MTAMRDRGAPAARSGRRSRKSGRSVEHAPPCAEHGPDAPPSRRDLRAGPIQTRPPGRELGPRLVEDRPPRLPPAARCGGRHRRDPTGSHRRRLGQAVAARDRARENPRHVRGAECSSSDSRKSLRFMAHLDVEASNALFQTFEDWSIQLRDVDIDNIDLGGPQP